jgi:glycerol-3-phosphate dehydrogenase (NAD(P)+)
MKTAVLSDGAWGTALALLLAQNGHQVTQWGPFPDYVTEMRRTRRNDRFLKGVELPPALGLTGVMAEAVAGAELIVLASPTQYARATLMQLKAVGLGANQVLVNVAKGIEIGTLKRLSEMCAEILGNASYCVLSGPSYAEEVAHGVPTVVVVASANRDHRRVVQANLMSPRFRVYTSDDVVGVELGGALKNVFAIAAGICDGMKLGDNAKAALLTRGVAEMARLGQALGGRPETFSGLSGLGDIIVTCTGRYSRNRHVGEELGKGGKLADIIKSMGMVVAEGVTTTQSAHALAQRLLVPTPIISEVYAGLYEGKDARAAVRDLMTRSARPERD